MRGRPRLDLELCTAVRETCAANSLRKATRAVTGLFDGALRPVGLRVSQLSILVALALAEEVSVSKLAGWLGLDRTTMTRNLAPLERRGLLQSVAGPDARHRALRLTAKGRVALARALPIWRRVQARVVAGLGDRGWTSLHRELKATIDLGRRA